VVTPGATRLEGERGITRVFALVLAAPDHIVVNCFLVEQQPRFVDPFRLVLEWGTLTCSRLSLFAHDYLLMRVVCEVKRVVRLPHCRIKFSTLLSLAQSQILRGWRGRALVGIRFLPYRVVYRGVGLALYFDNGVWGLLWTRVLSLHLEAKTGERILSGLKITLHVHILFAEGEILRV